MKVKKKNNFSLDDAIEGTIETSILFLKIAGGLAATAIGLSVIYDRRSRKKKNNNKSK